MATKTKVLGFTYFVYLCQYGEVWVRFGQEVPQGLQYTGRKVLNPTDLGPVFENFVLCPAEGVQYATRLQWCYYFGCPSGNHFNFVCI